MVRTEARTAKHKWLDFINVKGFNLIEALKANMSSPRAVKILHRNQCTINDNKAISNAKYPLMLIAKDMLAMCMKAKVPAKKKLSGLPLMNKP
jgi:hypothetical protein